MSMRIAAFLAPRVMIVAAGFFDGRQRKPDMAFANRLTMEMFIPAPVRAALADRRFGLGGGGIPDNRVSAY